MAALECKVPDRIPHFEIEYQLAGQMFGKDFLRSEELKGLSQSEIEYKLAENAEYMAKVYGELEYSIIPVSFLNTEHTLITVRHLKKILGDSVMLAFTKADGTYDVPDGDRMYEFSYRIADEPEELHAQAARKITEVTELNLRMREAGVDCFVLCCDYCYNSGPFLSPKLFSEFVTPYLAKEIEAIRKMGGYAIKHTDGNIMPILDQLLECHPHALHSIDPMAGVDIAEVKKIASKSGVALCGNVNCALMQTGTEAQIIDSAMYAINNASVGGGYIFSTSNCAFLGLPPENYRLILDVWKKHRDYK